MLDVPHRANLGNDHGFIINDEFIIKEYFLIGVRLFGKPKQSHESESLCSNWTISY